MQSLSTQQPQQQPPQRPKLNNASDPAALNSTQNHSSSGHATGNTSASSTPAEIVLSRRNNIAAAINQLNLSPDFRHYEKITNLSQQQASNMTPNRFPSIAPGGLNVYNANYCYNEASAASTADKFASDSNGSTLAIGATTAAAAAAGAAGAGSTTADAFELFNISGAAPSASEAPASNMAAAVATTTTIHAGRQGISLTTQNVFETSADGGQQQQRRISTGDGVGPSSAGALPLQADLLFYDLGDEHAMATWGSVGVNGEPNGAGMMMDSDGDALDARVLNANGNANGGSTVRRPGGGLRGLFRTVRRQFGKPNGRSGSHR